MWVSSLDYIRAPQCACCGRQEEGGILVLALSLHNILFWGELRKKPRGLVAAAGGRSGDSAGLCRTVHQAPGSSKDQRPQATRELRGRRKERKQEAMGEPD